MNIVSNFKWIKTKIKLMDRHHNGTTLEPHEYSVLWEMRDCIGGMTEEDFKILNTNFTEVMYLAGKLDLYMEFKQDKIKNNKTLNENED